MFIGFGEQMEPRWKPKSSKIDKTLNQHFQFFLKGFLKHFGKYLGANIEETSMRKRCQKHVGNVLEVEVAKT